MKHPITRGMAVFAGAMLLVASSIAQTTTDTTSDLSVNCPPTGSVGPSKSTKHMAKHGTSVRTAQVSRGELQLRRKLDQCGDKADRNARAECVRDAWESAHPMPSTTTASLERKAPC